MAILWLVLAATVVFGAKAATGRQLNAAMRRCDCVCRPVLGTYPWVLEDLRVALARGESMRRHPVLAPGPLVCLRPDEPDVDGRFAELQGLVDAGEARRLEGEAR